MAVSYLSPDDPLGYMPPVSPDDPLYGLDLTLHGYQIMYAIYADKQSEKHNEDGPSENQKIAKEVFESAATNERFGNGGTKIPSNIYSEILRDRWFLKIPSKVLEDETALEALMKKRLGRKYKQCLFRLYPTLKGLNQRCRGEEYFVPLSCNNEWRKSVYGSTAAAAEYIRKLCELGVLYKYSSYYHFYQGHEGEGTSRNYLVDKPAVKALLHYAESHALNTLEYEKSSHFYKTQADLLRETAKGINSEDARYKKLLDIAKIGRVHKKLSLNDYTEDEIKAAVCVNHPDVLMAMDAVDAHNKLVPIRFQHIAKINLTVNSRDEVTKIGFRATNHLVSLPKRPKFKESRKDLLTPSEYNYSDNGIAYREAVFEEHFEHGYLQCDVKSSIPRNILLRNTSTLPPPNEDLYEKAFNKYHLNAFSEDIREAAKKFAMYPMFSGNKPKGILHRLSYTHPNGSCTKFIRTYGKDYSVKVIDNLVTDLTTTLGGEIPGSSIFAQESNIYETAFLMLAKHCKKLHLKTPILVYDCFYCDNRINLSQDEYERLITSFINKAISQRSIRLKTVTLNDCTNISKTFACSQQTKQPTNQPNNPTLFEHYSNYSTMNARLTGDEVLCCNDEREKRRLKPPDDTV